METVVPLSEYVSVLERLVVDVVAIGVFAVGIYFRRHRKADMAMVYGFFNICLFVTAAVIQLTEVSAAFGFGLFAILSIIRLRSEPFNNSEIGYFMGALVLGLVNGVGTGALWLTAVLNLVVLAAIAILDHPRVLPKADRCTVVLDQIFADEGEAAVAVGSRMGRVVERVDIISVDYVRDAMQLEVRFVAGERHPAPLTVAP